MLHILSVCFSLIYPACKDHAPYFIVVCDLYSCTAFIHIVSQAIQFWRKKLLNINKMRVLIFSTILSETFHTPRRIERNMIKMCICLYVNYPLFLLDFNETWISSTQFRKILNCIMSLKSVQWKLSRSMRTERHVTKLTVAFRNFANALRHLMSRL